MSEVARKRGGQNTFDQDKANAVCDYLSQGDSLNTACKKVGIEPSTVRGWVTFEHRSSAEFAAQYARARDQGLEARADLLYDIANGTGVDRTNITVNRDRLRFDAVRWELSKLKPGRYGDKLEVKQDTTLRQIKEDPVSIEEHKEEWVKNYIDSQKTTH